MVIVLHPEQEAEVRLLAAELELPIDEVVAHLLSGPLNRQWSEGTPTENRSSNLRSLALVPTSTAVPAEIT